MANGNVSEEPGRPEFRVKGSELRGEAASLLIYTAAKREKAECGRTTFLLDTAAI